MRILLVEDNGPLRLSMAQHLSEAGYTVDQTADGREGLWMAQENNYALAILDLMLPGADGMDILRAIRTAKTNTGVLIITARDEIGDRVRGLDEGADDYLVKPFALDELLARARALLRRTFGQRQSTITVGNLEIDTHRRVAHRAGTQLELTSKEYSLLELLALRGGEVVSRADIWEQLYDFSDSTESNVTDVFIAHLRKKMELGDHTRLIHTRRGEGYVLESR
jgi:two-component system copper resistance phosphate regulon response regulator CusR